MTYEQVKEIYTDLRDKYEAKLLACGVKCESEIYCVDNKPEKVDIPDGASYFVLDINVFTDSIDKDHGVCLRASVPISNMRVDDDDILEEKNAFEETIDEFMGRLTAAPDADEFIKNELEEHRRNLEEIMREFERKIKNNNTVALIAVGICAVAAAVALIMHFLV